MLPAPASSKPTAAAGVAASRRRYACAPHTVRQMLRMELILVRHALPERQQVATGTADPPLSTIGVEQAAKVARWLSGETIDTVYSSPMRRANETASAYVAAAAATRSSSTKASSNSTATRRATSRWRNSSAPTTQRGKRSPTAATTTRSTFSRSRTPSCARSNRSSRATTANASLVFCHGGVINVWAAHVLKMVPRLFFEPDYTSIHRFLCARSGERNVVSLNETATCAA